MLRINVVQENNMHIFFKINFSGSLTCFDLIKQELAKVLVLLNNECISVVSFETVK
jgi:hypothetical protein